MEAATKNKNKRGRPRTYIRDIAESVRDENTIRSTINDTYGSAIFASLTGEEKDFFVTERGKVRRKGILEQLGRMYDADIISGEEITDCVRACIKLYNDGMTVKEIENRLRDIRTGKR